MPVMEVDDNSPPEKRPPVTSQSRCLLTMLILLLTILTGFLTGFFLPSWILFWPSHPSSSPLTLLSLSISINQHQSITDRPRWTTDRLARRLPACLIIGVRKSGTRALLEFLNLHPRIRKAADEIHFFDEEQNYAQGAPWYRRKMPFSYADQLTVEKSPAYFITRHVPRRVQALNQSMKLIVVVRNPVQRVISDYTQTMLKRLHKGKPVERFEETVLDEWGNVDLTYRPVRISIYHQHLSNWLKYFPRHRIHIVDGEQLVQDPVSELQQVEEFLGLEHKINQDHLHFNQTKGFFCIRDPEDPSTDRCLSATKGRPHPRVQPTVIAKLETFFAPHNRAFYKMAGRDFNW